MRRAFIGFSSPIGYSYSIDAPRTRNDQGSSPNPVLFGSMGLFTLYDELWFACESLCPSSMRSLPYVRFLDRDGPAIDLSSVGFKENIEDIVKKSDRSHPHDVNSMFPNGFGDGMNDYLGGDFATDNHTHALKFFGIEMTGNPAYFQLVTDICLVQRNKHMEFDLVFNPLTALIGFENMESDGISQVKQLGLAEMVLTFGTLYDITGSEGPYHPCIEEIRNDDLILEFRAWMDQQTTRLDNQDIRSIEADVNAKIRDLTRKGLREYVKHENLAAVGVKLAKDELLGKIPGGSVISTVSDAVAQNVRANEDRWKAFIALTRDTLDEGRN